MSYSETTFFDTTAITIDDQMLFHNNPPILIYSTVNLSSYHPPHIFIGVLKGYPHKSVTPIKFPRSAENKFIYIYSYLTYDLLIHKEGKPL